MVSVYTRKQVILFALATIVAYWSTRSLDGIGVDTTGLLDVTKEHVAVETIDPPGVTNERIEALESALLEIKSQLNAAEQRLHETGDDLPDCVELMSRPNSPYADGYFITRHTTSHKWTPRHDGSRQFDLTDICKLKRYTADDAKQCLANQHVNFIGDSLTRYQFFSLAHFLEKGQYPPRFGIPRAGMEKEKECDHIDERGVPQCSPSGQPNLCMENDWWFVYRGETWQRLFANVGGGEDGGMFGGRMECSCARLEEVENEVYVSQPGADGEQTVLSSFMENGHGEAKPIKGFAFTGCAFKGTCRSSYKQVVQRDNNNTMDFEQLLVDALNPEKGFLRNMLPPVNISIYNRGILGELGQEKASAVFPLLYTWTCRENGRCFYKTTTGAPWHFDKMHDREIGIIRELAYSAGCSFMDYGHITREFATHKYFPKKPPRTGGGILSINDEREFIYMDSVHFMPWVYEELNNVLLNVLCNNKQAKKTLT